jgi:long-chain fatty acid transport protein
MMRIDFAHLGLALGCATILGLTVGYPADGHAGGVRATDHANSAGTVADDAGGVGLNPGAMGLVEGTGSTLDLQLSLRHQTYHRRGRNSQGADYEKADSLTVRAYPTFNHVSDLGTDWFRLGFSVRVPFQYSSDWPTDGAQRYENIFHDVTAINLTPAIGFRPVEWLSFGASFSYVLADYRSYRAYDFGNRVAREEGVDPDTVPDEDPGNEGRQYMNFTGEAFGWSAGLALSPGDVRVGLAYHSPIDLELSGDYELYPPNNTYYDRRYGGTISRSAELRTRWPSEVRAGVAWEVSKTGEIWLDAAWTHWSMVDERVVDVEETQGETSYDTRETYDWNDTLEVRLGGYFGVAEDWRVHGEVGFESTAIPPGQLSPRVVDAPKIMAGAGVGWDISELLTLQLGYQHVYYIPREVPPRDAGSTPPGQYTQHRALIETGLSYQFQ